VHGQPIGLGDVKRTATRIRRRRNLAAGAVAAAVVAIAIPSVMVAGNLFPNASDGSNGPATEGPSPSVTTVLPKPDGPVVLDPDAPQGASPEIPYLAGKTLRVGGNELPLAEEYGGIVRAADEYVVWGQSDVGWPFIKVLDSEGRVVATSSTTSEAVGSVDGTVAAWITPGGKIQTRFQGRTVQLGTVEGDQAQPVAVLGSGSCMEEEGGCTVFYNVLSADEQSPRVASSHGTVDDVSGQFTNLNGIHEEAGLAAGLVREPTNPPEQAQCGQVEDLATSKELFRTCDYTWLYRNPFSPDGSLVLGNHIDADGAGPRSIVVLDSRTGELRIELEVEGARETRAGNIVGARWENDNTLLVTVEEPAGVAFAYTVFRVTLDGGVEKVLGPSDPTGGSYQPYLFLG
jgi:hypothetical protein